MEKAMTIDATADLIDRWADVGFGFVLGVAVMALVNAIVSASMRWW